MYKCEICEFETNSRESMGGHRSGHVRRNELAKLLPSINVEHECSDCGKKFASGQSLGGHRITHQKSIGELTSTGTIRRRLISETAHQCEACKNTEWMGKPIPLELDHINGNPNDNSRENLRLLCPNCHAQTDTYKTKNKGRPFVLHRDKYKSHMEKT